MTSEPNTQGEGYSTNFHTGRLYSEIQPLTLFQYTIFDGKAGLKDGTSLTYLFSENKLLKLDVLLVLRVTFKNTLKCQNTHIARLSKHFNERILNDRFYYPFNISTSEFPTL